MKLEEAIKYLEKGDKCREWSCIECKQFHKELLGFLKELKEYRESNEWISTDDRLPEINIYVLAVYQATVIGNGTVEDAYVTGAIWFQGTLWFDEHGDRIDNKNVKYWKPMPELPKELLRE